MNRYDQYAGGVGFFPLDTLSVYSLLKVFPPTMSLVRRRLTSVSLRDLVTGYAAGTMLAACYAPGFEEDENSIVLGMQLAAYLQAVYLLDYLCFTRPWLLRRWVYRNEGDGSKKQYLIPPTAAAPAIVPNNQIVRNNLGVMKEGYLSPWTPDGGLDLLQTDQHPNQFVNPLNEEFDRIERLLMDRADPVQLENVGFEHVPKTKFGGGVATLPPIANAVFAPAAYLDIQDALGAKGGEEDGIKGTSQATNVETGMQQEQLLEADRETAERKPPIDKTKLEPTDS